MSGKHAWRRALLIAGILSLAANIVARAGGVADAAIDDAAKDEEPGSQLLRVDGSVMTADLNAITLGEVAGLLERNAGVRTRFASSEVQRLVISRRFEGKTIREGLREIFADTDYAMVQLDGAEGVRFQVLVYSRRPGTSGEGQVVGTDSGSTQQVAEGATGDVANASDAVGAELPLPLDAEHGSAEERVGALRLIAAAGGEQALGQVLAATNDPNPAVRSASAELMLEDLREVAPIADLSRLALQSEQVEIRLRALDALSERASESRYARITIDGARHDEDPRVRARAETLAADWAVDNQ